MIEYKLIGFQQSNFEAADHNMINGYNLTFTCPIDERYGKGERASRFWVSERVFADLKPVVGMKCDLRFSPYSRDGKARLQEIIKL